MPAVVGSNPTDSRITLLACGQIGKGAGLRIRCGDAWEFKSPHANQCSWVPEMQLARTADCIPKDNALCFG